MREGQEDGACLKASMGNIATLVRAGNISLKDGISTAAEKVKVRGQRAADKNNKMQAISLLSRGHVYATVIHRHEFRCWKGKEIRQGAIDNILEYKFKTHFQLSTAGSRRMNHDVSKSFVTSSLNHHLMDGESMQSKLNNKSEWFLFILPNIQNISLLFTWFFIVIVIAFHKFIPPPPPPFIPPPPAPPLPPPLPVDPCSGEDSSCPLP